MDGVDGEHLVDLETRVSQVATQLTPAVEVDLHPGDAAINHPAVAYVWMAEEELDRLSEQPHSALGVAEVEVQVVSVQREPSPGPQDAICLVQCLAPGRRPADHAQRAEHR